MSATANIYATLLPAAFAGGINLDSDPLYMALMGSGYTPSLTVDKSWSAIAQYQITSAGYTPGGVALTGAYLDFVAAGSWQVGWAASTAYGVGSVIAVGLYAYRALVSGVTGSTQPTFPTVLGETVTDGTIIWSCLGDGVLVFTTSAASWSGLIATVVYAVIYDATTNAVSPGQLISLQQFSSPLVLENASLTLSPHPNLGWFAFSPPA